MKSSIRISRGGRSITFRGSAARAAFEGVTGTKLPLSLGVGEHVCVGIKEPIPVGILTAFNEGNTSFPYEVEWTREDGTKYRTDCGLQLRKAPPAALTRATPSKEGK